MIDFNQTKQEAFGKWAGILERVGVDVGTGKHCPCPICGGKDRFRYDDKNGNGEYICGQCGAGDGINLIMKTMGLEYQGAMELIAGMVGTIEAIPHQKEKKVSPELLRKMFTESKPVIKHDTVYMYLKNRGLTSMPSKLRYSPKCHEPETKKNQEAMLAIFSDREGGAVTFHRTYLTSQGKKLDIKSPKKIMPPLKKMAGGAVRLYEYESGPLGICEGIETAIAVRELVKIPVWAALSTSLLETFEPPKNIKEIHVFGDNDKNFAGQKSAYILANRLSLKNIITEVYIPGTKGNDFLDDIQE